MCGTVVKADFEDQLAELHVRLSTNGTPVCLHLKRSVRRRLPCHFRNTLRRPSAYVKKTKVKRGESSKVLSCALTANRELQAGNAKMLLSQRCAPTANLRKEAPKCLSAQAAGQPNQRLHRGTLADSYNLRLHKRTLIESLMSLYSNFVRSFETH